MGNKTAAELTKPELIALLSAFIEQRPGMDPRNYGDWRAYRNESAEVTRDLRDARALLNAVEWSDIDAETIRRTLMGSGRLTLQENGRLYYCTGQYFPTEFRPAVSRLCASLLWDYVGDRIRASRAGDPPNVSYQHASVADAIRAYMARTFRSRRIMRHYFR